MLSILSANKREREREHNKMVDASSSEETPSETVAALFPVFLIAILSCFLFPVTLYESADALVF